MTAGFYSQQDGMLHYAPNFVNAPDFELNSAEHLTYIYPIGGWYWFDSEEEAKIQFNSLFKSYADKITELEETTTALIQVLNDKGIAP